MIPLLLNDTAMAVSLGALSKKYPLQAVSGSHTRYLGGEFWALKDISLSIPQGHILGILGRNGSGKTTLLNVVAGIVPPTKGKVVTKGKVLGLFNLGIGFQDELSGRENIFLNGSIIGAGKTELENALSAIIDFSELGDFIDMPLGSYSQGMRLRLGFSIIAHLDFEVLVIDEILTVGDILFQNKCFQRLIEFKHSGKTLLITTQSMDLLERLCDTVALLEHGCLLFHGEAEKAVNHYYALLNAKKFFVGLPKENVRMVETTKKWADNRSEWGLRLGTKEAEIHSLSLYNKFGLLCKRIRSGQPLKLRVNFSVNTIIKDPHFGIAIFRKDGVYCYGPNTLFDGHKIPELKKGKGWFSLHYKKLWLAPGEYVLSVAIWDKYETVAFDYHCGYYTLLVTGADNRDNKLLDVKAKYKLSRKKYRPYTFIKKSDARAIMPFLSDASVHKQQYAGIEIQSFLLSHPSGQKKGIFITNQPVMFRITISTHLLEEKGRDIWFGIFREDGIYCHGISFAIENDTRITLVYPQLPLLPGKYGVSIGLSNKKTRRPFLHFPGIHSFCMTFDKHDHGTVYLEHSWAWKMA